MRINTRNIYPDTHFSNYNYFLINQYHLRIEGLWVHENRYYIFCPEIDETTLAIDGTNLQKWFRNYSILGTPTNLVNSLPHGAQKVDSPSLLDQSNLAGSPRNYTNLLNDILSLLPKDFPEFKTEDRNTGILYFITKSPLTAEQEDQLKEVIHKIKISITVETEVSNTLQGINQPFLNDPIIIRHSRSINGLTGSKSKQLWEDDEDFWVEQRIKLLQPNTKKETFYPENFDTTKSSCLVTDYKEPQNLRNFLTLYNVTYIEAPLLENHETYFKQLGIQENEFIHLANIGRVKVLFTQPLHRYHTRLLDLTLEIPKNAYLTPRRLSSIVVADLRKRNPLLFPTFGVETKYKLLHELYIQELDGKLPKEFDTNFLTYLSKVWGDYFEAVHLTGTHGLRTFSSYHFLDSIFQSLGRDYGVELMDSVPSVDFGAALNANVIPKYWKGYSDEKMLSIIANLYSGVPKDFLPINFPYSNTSVDNVLVINKDVPIIDLAETFTNHDIDRFRNLIFDLTRHKKSEDELLSSLKLFNEHVRNYESSKKRMSAFDISGFLIDGTLAVSGVNIPLASWVVDKTKKILEYAGIKSGTIQELVDNLEVMRTGTTLPNAVLVARMRSHLKESWYKRQLKKIGL